MSTLSFKEMVRWSYQQNITPNLVTPDDIVRVYKNLVREQKERASADEESKMRVQAGMLDFDAFKKAVVRISINA